MIISAAIAFFGIFIGFTVLALGIYFSFRWVKLI